MSEPCPWCAAPLGDEAACPSCMRDPALHPSRAEDTGGLELDFAPPPPATAPPSDAPTESLDLPPLTALEAPDAPADEPAEASAESLPGLALDLDHAPAPSAPPPSEEPAESLPELALDLDPPPAAGPPEDGQAPSLELEEEAKPTPAPAPLPLAPEAAAVPPSGVAPEARAAALAGWGPAPDSPLGWPAYAVRVLLRRRALRKEIEGKRQAHRQAVRAVLEEQASLITPLVAAKSPAVAPFEPLLEEVDTKAEAKKAEVAAVSQAKSSELAAADAKLEQAHQERRQRSRDLEVAKAFREQAQARLRAAEDDLVARKRAVDEAHEAAQRAAPGAEFAPPDHARAIVAAEEAAAAAAADLPERKAKLDEAKRKEHERRKAMAATEKTLERLVRERSRVEFEIYAVVGDERAALDEVVDRRLESYGEVLTRILQEAPRAFDPATLERARTLRSRRQRLDDEQAALEAAPDAYDAETLQRGLVLLAVAALVVVVAGVALVV